MELEQALLKEFAFSFVLLWERYDEVDCNSLDQCTRSGQWLIRAKDCQAGRYFSSYRR
jgi:hypothetical protein